MIATETIRAMLDERGVEWRTHGMTDRTWFDVGGISWFVIERENGGIAVEAVFLTPEQAVEVTMGRGMCKNLANHKGRVEFVCSECGAHYLGFKFKHCPNCGRKVRA